MRDGAPDDWPIGHQPTLAKTVIGGSEVWCECGWHSPSTEPTTRAAYDGWRKHLMEEIEGRPFGLTVYPKARPDDTR